MLTCRDQQAAAYKGSRKINRPATHPIHFVADSPDKIIAALRKRGPTPNPAHGSHLTVRTGGTMTKTNVQPIPSNSQHHDTPNNKTRIE